MAGVLAALAQLRHRPWLALDTETTGLGPYDVIIEIALVEGHGAILADTTVAPGRPVTAKSSQVHGLQQEDLAEAPSWTSLWPQIQALLHSHSVVAWNAAFDLRLLRQTCDRYGLPMAVRRILCLKQAFRQRHPVTRPTLAAACLALSIAERPNHRARVDAEVARQVAWKLMPGGDVQATED